MRHPSIKGISSSDHRTTEIASVRPARFRCENTQSGTAPFSGNAGFLKSIVPGAKERPAEIEAALAKAIKEGEAMFGKYRLVLLS